MSNGINLLTFAGLIFVLVGLFVIVQSLIGEFLPHDTKYLGLDARQLGALNQKVVNFMFHDRISFGGTLIAIGILYMWLSEFPLREKQEWAWWIFLISGFLGFCSFLTYLGYGYLDSYHGYASLALIPVFLVGIVNSYRSFDEKPRISSLKKIVFRPNLKSTTGVGYYILFFIAFGITLGGLVIMVVGMTTVYVPQDLAYMTMCTSDFVKINPRLTPLIAHDRASFGGGLFSIGLVIFLILKCAEPSKSLWQTLALSLFVGFATAIGVHFWIGYLSFIHLAPAYLGALLFLIGIVLTYQYMNNQQISYGN